MFSGSSAFTAVRRQLPYGTRDIKFRTALYNDGNDFSIPTGEFTCRIAGQYWFSATITKAAGYFVNELYCYIVVNDVAKLSMYTKPYGANLSTNSVSASAAFQLNLGDRVKVGNCSDVTVIDDGLDTHFSGILIKPDA